MSHQHSHRPMRRSPRRALSAVAALGVAILSGCATAPDRATEPAGRHCTERGRVCDVHLVRGADPVVVRSGKDGSGLYVLRLTDARTRGIELATTRYDKPFKVPGRPGYVPKYSFGGGVTGLHSGASGSRLGNATFDTRTMSVDSAEIRVTFDRSRGR